MSILRLQGYRCSMNHAFTYSPMWNKRMLQPSKWMRNLIPILYVVIALAQANKLRPAPIIPNPLLCRAVPFSSQPHSSHPSLLPYLEKEHIRSQNVRSCDQMFPFDVKHITVLLFYQANFRPFKYIRHFRQFRSTSFVQNSKHMFVLNVTKSMCNFPFPPDDDIMKGNRAESPEQRRRRNG